MRKTIPNAVQSTNQGLCLPMQAAPIDRTPAGAAALADASGAEPCFDWSWLGPVVQGLGGALGGI
jgi:hypothetical protein